MLEGRPAELGRGAVGQLGDALDEPQNAGSGRDDLGNPRAADREVSRRQGGILAPPPEVRAPGLRIRQTARDRAEIVLSARTAEEAASASLQPPVASEPAPAQPKARTGRYLLWHELLRRVFEIDVLACPKCGGRLRLLCTVHDGFSTRRYLQGVSAQAPSAEARPPPCPVEPTSA